MNLSGRFQVKNGLVKWCSPQSPKEFCFWDGPEGAGHELCMASPGGETFPTTVPGGLILTDIFLHLGCSPPFLAEISLFVIASETWETIGHAPLCLINLDKGWWFTGSRSVLFANQPKSITKGAPFLDVQLDKISCCTWPFCCPSHHGQGTLTASLKDVFCASLASRRFPRLVTRQREWRSWWVPFATFIETVPSVLTLW